VSQRTCEPEKTLFEPLTLKGPDTKSKQTLLDLLLDHYDELNRLIAMESSTDDS
jgi:hypothetical protein